MAWPTTSRQSRGYDAAWDRLRKRILRRDRYLCQPCAREGRVTAATEVDHLKRKADGGTDDPSNLEATCSPCHSAKTAAEKGHKIKPRIGADGWPL
jgi:5-methylcytosine-specific restriction protein A